MGFNEFVFMADTLRTWAVPREQELHLFRHPGQMVSEGKHCPVGGQCGGDGNDGKGYDNINNKCPLSTRHRTHGPAHQVKPQGPELKM